MAEKGFKFRHKYITNKQFLPRVYDRQSYYIKAFNDKETVFSAYSFMLGVYPEDLAWINYKRNGLSAGEFEGDSDEYIRKTITYLDGKEVPADNT